MKGSVCEARSRGECIVFVLDRLKLFELLRPGSVKFMFSQEKTIHNSEGNELQKPGVGGSDLRQQKGMIYSSRGNGLQQGVVSTAAGGNDLQWQGLYLQQREGMIYNSVGNGLQ